MFDKTFSLYGTMRMYNLYQYCWWSHPLLCPSCQVENLIVGAPCGIMDQMACSLGKQGQLLALLCQPASVLAFLPLHPSLALWGLESGLRHSLSQGGSDYASVRAAAFMGRCIIQVGPALCFPEPSLTPSAPPKST